ncbi:diguanylate cyclase domain-containing protein [Candidatus Formimonas warabiya]|uniref:Stage 0 sporulation protein A homolog n=1 Tax=Formimonas warabiya TaxID=1761012 RepID=A0A3G1KWT4_FORW1|nr:diguanylate cyclase [Candidatus Formimonas warabiya]ATW26880.1 hypothetical protein DCMF_20820 [Candidatus Formimonas warabiya]
MGNKKASILVVDDNDDDLQVLGEVIEKEGYQPVLASGGEQALELISMKKPDLILLDATMPEMNGYVVCRRLKKDPETRDIPVIFLTSEWEDEDIVKCFESGGADYLKKPFDSIELLAKLKTHIEWKKSRNEVKHLDELLQKKNQELSEANKIIKVKTQQLNQVMGLLEQDTRTDPLTGLCNRRHALKLIDDEVVRYQRNQKPFSLVISAIEDLDVIHDTYGHDCGHAVLQMVTQIFISTVREMDSVARWGEGEFLIILPETGFAGAKMLEKRIRKKLEEQAFFYNKEIIPITMTFGAATFIGGESKEDVIKRADNALNKKSKR